MRTNFCLVVNILDDVVYVMSVAEDGFCIISRLFRSNDGLMMPSIVRKLNFRANLLSMDIGDVGEDNWWIKFCSFCFLVCVVCNMIGELERVVIHCFLDRSGLDGTIYLEIRMNIQKTVF